MRFRSLAREIQTDASTISSNRLEHRQEPKLEEAEVGRGDAILRGTASCPGLPRMNRADNKSLDPREVELKQQL
jgi:hypothetical protein